MSTFSFVYITDTHIGNDGTGWGHHPLRPDLLSKMMPGLCDLVEEYSCEFVLHGGDVIDNGSIGQQKDAARLMEQLPVPVLLSLGNHDLAERDSYSRWLAEYPGFFRDGRADYVVACGGVDVYVLTCLWLGENRSPGYWWNTENESQHEIGDRQLEWLEVMISCRDGRGGIVVMHGSPDPLPVELTGMAEAIHVPSPSFDGPVNEVLDRHENIKLVLSGHCHATCMTRHGGRVHLTTSAFCEPPFQVRLVSITNHEIEVRTVCPVDYEQLGVCVNEENRWSFGRADDLGVSIPL